MTIAHEKLIDAWPWLRQLVDENREIIVLQNQISRDAQDWVKKEDDDYLYGGVRLLQVEENKDQLRPGLDPLSEQFIQASLEQRQQEIDEEEARRQKEQEQQRALAEEQRKRAEEAEVAATNMQRRSNIALGFAVGALVLAVFALLFFRQAQTEGRRAEEQARIVQSQALAVVADAISDEEPLLAAQLALEAEGSAESGLAFDVANRTIPALARPRLTLAHDDSVWGAAWNGDESRILTWSGDGTARVWDGESETPPAHPGP